jgi:streptomycin 6-kinase
VLPPDLAEHLVQVWGDEGRRWIAAFPMTLRQLGSKWGLRYIRPARDLSYNFVAYAERGDEEVVLKLGVSRAQLASEARAIRALGGSARLLDFDESHSALLLERLLPGESLWSTWSAAVDEEQTEVAARLIEASKPVADEGFPKVRDWFFAFESHVTGARSESKLDKAMLDRAIRLGAELHAGGGQEAYLLHGDLHHGNILSSGAGWKTIDPKGVIGERGFEAGTFIRNPADRILGAPDLAGLLERRLRTFSQVLGIEIQRLRSWCYCACVLSACWSAEDNESDDVAVACAAILWR